MSEFAVEVIEQEFSATVERGGPTTAELIARIKGATIAPAVVAATGKLSTTSTAADSIETAGGVVAAAAVAASADVIFAAGNTSTHGTFLTARGTQEWYLRSAADAFVGSIRYVTPSNLPGISFYNSAGGDRSDIIGAQDGSGFRFRLDGLNTMRLFRGNPGASTAGQTNIGNGIVDTAARVVARSTAADAIQSLGGYRADASGAYHFGDPTANDSWRITRSGTDLVIQRRESGSWVTKSTIAA